MLNEGDELDIINQSINQSINQLVSQSVNQSANQSANQSISRSIRETIKSFVEVSMGYNEVKVGYMLKVRCVNEDELKSQAGKIQVC